VHDVTRRQRPRAATRAGHPPRAGFTVVEVIVAILILSIGLLGLAGTSAVVTRQMTDGSRRGQAAGLAQTRFDSLASVGGCNSIGAVGTTVTGKKTTRGVAESWTARRSGDLTVTVTDTVRVARAKSPLVFESVIRCD
jgi:prepilin-type N-terminal cleavage/methylation domain-containing protein